LVALTFVTYARIPPEDLYNVSREGLAGGASRALVELNYPTALTAIPILGICAALLRRRAAYVLAAVGVVLCVFVPFAVDPQDLDARPINVLPASGVAIAVGMTVWVLRRTDPGWPGRPRGDWVRIAAAAVVIPVGIPWWFAAAGFYAPGPFLSDIVPPGEVLAAVHLGSHHGTAGAMLVLAALALSRLLPGLRSRLTPWVSGVLALALAYGAANAAQDFWLEQVVKRGTAERGLPDMVLPSLSWGWLGIVLGAVAVEVLWFRRERGRAGPATAAPGAS
jgi:ABC-type amino acid transport system permease subunit